MIGEAGLKDAIEETGYVMDEEAPDYVVIGLDWQVDYEKFAIATLAIQRERTLSGPTLTSTFQQSVACCQVQDP